MKKNEQELLLEVGAAGGSLSVWSLNAEDGRAFVVKKNENTLKDFMTEDDASGLTFESKTDLLNTFDDALNVLGLYPWYRLYPLFVHQDFIDVVLAAVTRLGGEKEAYRWRVSLKK